MRIQLYNINKVLIHRQDITNASLYFSHWKVWKFLQLSFFIFLTWLKNDRPTIMRMGGHHPPWWKALISLKWMFDDTFFLLVLYLIRWRLSRNWCKIAWVIKCFLVNKYFAQNFQTLWLPLSFFYFHTSNQEDGC